MTPVAYFVRFKGHACASVRSGLSRKPILLRARKGEELFVSEVADVVLTETNDPEDVPALARLKCARAIKRTNELRRRLQGDHMLRGTAAVERLLRDYATPHRRGKRWKICPIFSTPETPK